jgi:hypothetical protein
VPKVDSYWADFAKHPPLISPTGAQALQQENFAVSMIMIGIVGGEGAPLDQEAASITATTAAPAAISGAESVPSGSFSISDWSGHPSGAPQPTGPFRLIEGAEYDSARSAANSANRTIRQADPDTYAGQQIHEIQPVKFGGTPHGPC